MKKVLEHDDVLTLGVSFPMTEKQSRLLLRLFPEVNLSWELEGGGGGGGMMWDCSAANVFLYESGWPLTPAYTLIRRLSVDVAQRVSEHTSPVSSRGATTPHISCRSLTHAVISAHGSFSSWRNRKPGQIFSFSLSLCVTLALQLQWFDWTVRKEQTGTFCFSGALFGLKRKTIIAPDEKFIFTWQKRQRCIYESVHIRTISLASAWAHCAAPEFSKCIPHFTFTISQQQWTPILKPWNIFLRPAPRE